MKKPTLKRPNKPFSRTLIHYLFLTLLGLVIFNTLVPPQRSTQTTYSDMKSKIKEGKLKKVVITGENVIGELTDAERDRAVSEKKDKTLLPSLNTISAARLGDDPELLKLLDEVKVPYEFKAQENPTRDFFIGLLGWILPFILMFALWNFMFRKMGPGSEVMRFGKNKNSTKPEQDLKTTFDDVAGQDEAKEELKEVVEFLKQPQRYTQLGGKLPKGILLVGPPGTGKTLLAKAVAGEAKVPFFSISGSDFVEMFVGVGAARVRDLFAQAKSQAPCIIFIDELDAVGKARGVGPMGGHDEREQTLNQLLVEMDGFDTQKGIMIVAATNRPEILDPALLRAGRFDRQVLVGRPDVKERYAILKLHSKTIKLDSSVDLEKVARATPGMVGADLANMVNEAALLAARRGQENVKMPDFEEAIERNLAGLEKKNRVINKKEREVVAHHEAGHALIAALRNAADKVTKISIIPRGIGALGYTLQLPTEDRYLMTKSELVSKIDVLLGGQAAEKIIFDEISTGAADDLQRATNIARSMITQYGMSKALGPVTVDRERTPMMMDQSGLSTGKNFSEETAREIDEEVRDILHERMNQVQELLRSKLPLLKEIAQKLLEKEALNEEEFLEIVRRSGAVMASA